MLDPVGGGGGGVRVVVGGGGLHSSLPTGLPNMFRAKGAGKFFLHTKSPYLVDPPPFNNCHSAR